MPRVEPAVSLDEVYVQTLADLMDLPLSMEQRHAVVAQFSLLREMAERVQSVNIPEEFEAAPVFHP